MTTSKNDPTLRERQKIVYGWQRRRNRAFLSILGMGGVAIGFFLLSIGVIQLPDSVNEHIISGVGYAILLFFFFLFRRTLICPACEGRVWPPRAKVCPHCGIALMDTTTGSGRFSPPNPTAPSSLQCEEARKKLAEKMKVFDTLRRYERFMYYALIPISLAAGGWLYSGVKGLEELWVPLFGAAVVYMLGWFFLIYAVHNLCFPFLWINRAKCPHCGTPFSKELGVPVPGHIVFYSSVPDFCTGCGCRFRP